jgi:hypothetical protein
MPTRCGGWWLLVYVSPATRRAYAADKHPYNA